MSEIALHDLEIYSFVDPAGGKQKAGLKKVRARQAIITVGVDYLMRIFVLDAWAGRLVASKFRDKVIEVYDKWQPRRMGIEDNAMQSLFGDLVHDEAQKVLGGRIRIFGVPSPTKIEKDFKIRTALEPALNAGRLFIPASMVELLAEIQGFPTWHLKDLVDCLAMCVMLIPRRATQLSRDTEKEAMVKYLRDTGAPSGMIAGYAATGRLDRSYSGAEEIEGATAWQQLLRMSQSAPEGRYA